MNYFVIFYGHISHFNDYLDAWQLAADFNGGVYSRWGML